MKCEQCGALNPDSNRSCGECGSTLDLHSPANEFQNISLVSAKNKNTAIGLCLMGLIGVSGLHRLYVGKPISGLLYLFTGGLLGMGTLYDLFQLFIGQFLDNANQPLRNPSGSFPKYALVLVAMAFFIILGISYGRSLFSQPGNKQQPERAVIAVNAPARAQGTPQQPQLPVEKTSKTLQPTPAAPIDSALIFAAKQNNLSAVNDAIRAGANVNAGLYYTSDNRFLACMATPLYEAQDDVVIKRLLAAGANPKVGRPLTNPHSLTPSLDKIKLLVSHGADIEQTNESGQTVIEILLDMDARGLAELNSETVKSILSAGYNPNHRNEETGRTALHYFSNTPKFSISKAYEKSMKLFIANGADIYIKDNYGFYPIDYAVSNGNIVAVNILRGNDYPEDSSVPLSK